MSELIERYRAALDDAERVALAATAGPWTVVESPFHATIEIRTAESHPRWRDDPDPQTYPIVSNGDFHEAVDRCDARHIAAWDPALALRVLATMRERVDRHSPDPAWLPEVACVVCVELGMPTWPCPELLADVRALLGEDAAGHGTTV